ncbi:CpsD/CapB family tyrosine-protein kinase [Lactococcus lactis]|uniref:CpsD/CapB family tyrosine-protein kinase n=1 Tax=Lactococcus lactis TaxID=1358 RepID=UPI001652AF8D|nr:CpsD/CapB family tyrosine-protein kinase [Lactococcus lactis]QNL92860.1 CpsD/CapB family tyrosine-protein kinase [Lactococcus lactis]
MFKRREKFSNRSGRDQRLIAYINPTSPITEQYRSLRTNIEYAQIDKVLQTIAITSASPAEGKSTTIANLAVTYAQQGKKVLIIDADLRKPSLQKIFRKDNVNGLSDVLMGKVNINKSINEIQGVPGLFLIPSGFIPFNHSELLSSNAMHDLISALKEYYDIILIDTPPVLIATDAQIVASICDATVLVAKSESTENKSLIDAKKRLAKVNANLIGVVLNQVKNTNDNSYYQYK